MKGTRQKNIEKWLSRMAAGCKRKFLTLEVGRLRDKAETVGHSTLHIANHPAVESLVSIDMNPATEAVAREVLGPLVSKVEFINAKSRDALKRLAEEGKRQFDFIYLDGASNAEICFDDLQGALKVSHRGTVLILDDVDPACDKKGNLTVPWSQKHPEVVLILEHVPSDATSQGQLVLEVK